MSLVMSINKLFKIVLTNIDHVANLDAERQLFTFQENITFCALVYIFEE